MQLGFLKYSPVKKKRLYFYTAYGYVIQSEIELPGFIRIAESTPDFSITLDTSRFGACRYQLKQKIIIHFSAANFRIEWPGVATFDVRKNGEVIFRPVLPLCQGFLALQPFYGIVLAALLHQKNHFILHGSTVEINGSALTVVGMKGRGKSTLTGSLIANNCNLIADDVTALAEDGDNPVQVLPGIPRIKLWPDAVRAVGGNPEDMPLVAPSIPKHIFTVPDNQFQLRKMPLKNIVMLDHGEDVDMKEMTLAEKMTWLAGGQYFARFHQQFPPEIRRQWFLSCSRLARKVNIIRATFPRNLERLPEMTDKCLAIVDS